MKNQNREIFFLVEKYCDRRKYHPQPLRHTNRGPWKSTLNYMNKFTISETDGFEIAGVFTIENELSEVLKLNCLSRAKGIVHVFITKTLRKSNVWPDDISKFLSSIIIQNVKTLRVSFMEMFGSDDLTFWESFEYDCLQSRIDLYEVEELYLKQEDKYNRISLNNQLDSFYDQCINGEVQIGIVNYFYVQLLRPAELENLPGTYNTWGMELKRLLLEVYRVNLLASLSPIDSISMTPRSINVIYQEYMADFSRVKPPPDYAENYPMEDHRLFFWVKGNDRIQF